MRQKRIADKAAGMTSFSQPIESVTLLGIGDIISKKGLAQEAEELLAKKMAPGRLATNPAILGNTQERRALAAPLVRHPVAPNPNPNAAMPGPWVDTEKTAVNPPMGEVGSLPGILNYLKKRNMKQVPIPRSKGGVGWFPERGDIRDFDAIIDPLTEFCDQRG